jgi:hypothetical protein
MSDRSSLAASLMPRRAAPSGAESSLSRVRPAHVPAITAFEPHRSARPRGYRPYDVSASYTRLHVKGCCSTPFPLDASSNLNHWPKITTLNFT